MLVVCAGDTWIHGVGTDPLKVARWRAVSRLRSDCLRSVSCPSNTTTFHNFSRHAPHRTTVSSRYLRHRPLTSNLNPSHVFIGSSSKRESILGPSSSSAASPHLQWEPSPHRIVFPSPPCLCCCVLRGSDVKQLLRYSTDSLKFEYYSWTNDNLTHLLRTNADYHTLVHSWMEQRHWAIDIPLSALPPDHPIRVAAPAAFRAIDPPPLTRNATEGYTRYPLRPLHPFTVGSFNLTFSPTTGALQSLIHLPTQAQYADAGHPLGEVLYETFDEAHSYDTFLSDYISFDMDAPGSDQYPRYDFGKAGLDASAAPEVQVVRPRVRDGVVWLRRPGVVEGYDASFLLELDYADVQLTTKYGAPNITRVWVHVDGTEGRLRWVVVNVNKTRTRIPEAGWLVFNALNARNETIEVSKVSSWVALGEGVMGNGSAHLHVVGDEGVRLAGKVQGRSLDVGLICVGYPPTPFPTPLQRIVGNPGAFSFNLFNNVTQQPQLHLTHPLPHCRRWTDPLLLTVSAAVVRVDRSGV